MGTSIFNIKKLKSILLKISTVRPSKRVWISAGLLLLLSFTAMHAPARLAAQLNRSDVIHLDSLQGSIWNGSARLSAVNLFEKWLPLGHTAWQIHTSYLLLGALKTSVQTKDLLIESALEIVMRGKKIGLESSHAFVNPEIADAWLPRWFKVRGNLSIKINELLYNLRDKSIERLDSEVFWNQAEVYTLKNTYPIGSVILTIKNMGPVIQLGLSSPEDNPLMLSGTIDYQVTHIDFRVIAKPSDKTDKNVMEILSTLGGTPDESGVYTISYNHKL